MATNRKPVRKKSTSSVARKSSAPKSKNVAGAKKKTIRVKVDKLPAKSVPGSKAGHTARMRKAAQDLGFEKKNVAQVQKTPETLKEICAAVASANGVKTGSFVHVLQVPWEERAVALALGATWNNLLREYIFVGSLLPLKLRDWKSKDFSLTRWVEDEINRKIAPVAAPSTVFTLRSHQQEAVQKIMSCGRKGWRGFVEADSTGLGKSLSALVGASEVAKLKGFTGARKAKLLIVCPKTVIPHWRNTLVNSGVSNLRVMVVNYEQAPKLLTVPQSAKDAKSTRTKNKRVASSGKPLVGWDFIIADESHKLKNAQVSQAPKVFSQIARYSAEANKSPFIIYNSATIGQNPLELAYLAPLVGQALKKKLSLKNWGEYLEQAGYHVKKGKVGYSWVSIPSKTPPSVVAERKAQQREDIVRLSKILFNPVFPSIRRTPENINGWPKIVRIATPLELDENQTALYEEAWTEFRNYVKLHPHGKDPSGGLAATLRFRQKSSYLRAPNTVEFVMDLLDNKQQVAIYCEFLETVDFLKSKLGKKVEVAEFTGRNTTVREEERLRFQRGEAKVILFSAIEGVSFHAGEQLPDGSTATQADRALVIHDPKYSAIQSSQIEGRTSRDGKSANTFYMFAEGTVERRITETMIGRTANMKTLSGDALDLVEEVEALLD